MRNLVFGILVASIAILGFFVYQTGQKLVAANMEVTAKTEAVVSLEAEKAALAAQVATLQGEVDGLTKAAADAAAALGITAQGAAPAVEALGDAIGDEISTTP